jgi:molybdopterin converting factor small subunit
LRVLAIGRSGENGSLISCPITDGHRAPGRGGTGAVMGSKRLKTIAVYGTGTFSVADLLYFNENGGKRLIIQYSYFGVPVPPLTHEKQAVELPVNATIDQFMDIINEKIDDPTGKLLDEATFVVNNIGAMRETVLHDADKVIIMHAIAGGEWH